MSPRQEQFTHRTGAFTLIELLVVVAIIALLISILLPSMKDAREQARTVVCNSNIRSVSLAVIQYQEDHGGFLPDTQWSEAAWWTAKRDLWMYKLFPRYLGEPKALICASDPFRSEFDFEAADEQGNPRSNLEKAASSYGLTYVVRHYSAGQGSLNIRNLHANPPMWLDRTILMAEVGPDNRLEYAPLYNVNLPNGSTVTRDARPWRDGGRLLWDDGNRGWYSGPTWLTARHRGYIHMTAMDGHSKKVRTREMLTRPILSQYRGQAQAGGIDCMGWIGSSRKYVCALCYEPQRRSKFPPYDQGASTPHYTFARDNLWWWTGKFPFAAD